MGGSIPSTSTPSPGTGSSQLATRLFSAWLTLKTALKPFSINEIKTWPPARPRLFPQVPLILGREAELGAREDPPPVFPASLFLWSVGTAQGLTCSPF